MRRVRPSGRPCRSVELHFSRGEDHGLRTACGVGCAHCHRVSAANRRRSTRRARVYGEGTGSSSFRRRRPSFRPVGSTLLLGPSTPRLFVSKERTFLEQEDAFVERNSRLLENDSLLLEKKHQRVENDALGLVAPFAFSKTPLVRSRALVVCLEKTLVCLASNAGSLDSMADCESSLEGQSKNLERSPRAPDHCSRTSAGARRKMPCDR